MRSRSVCVAAAFAAVCVSGATSASAGILWNNGAPTGAGSWCDQNASGCSSSGWTIYDDFQLTSTSEVTGLTYNADFTDYGSGPSAYSGTDYSIWTSNPVTSWASGPAFSGTLVGSTSADGVGTTLVTITGLDISLGAGTYWLGLQNNVNDDSITTYDVTGHTHLGSASQSDYAGNFYNPSIADAAFTVEGVPSGVPEPATWALMLVGVGGMGAALRSRIRLTTAHA